MSEYLWQDKKRPFLGKPLSFTKYFLTEEKLLVRTGFIHIVEEEIRLYRIADITLNCSFLQRLFNVGTIHCCSSDRTSPELDIVSVKNPRDVKELLSKMVEEDRQKKNVIEYMH